jgi:glycosyltransferase involved in cell wall biosynthesis
MRPLEIIVVDNNSVEPIYVPNRHLATGTPIRLLTCTKPGAAAARNVGAAAAQGNWLLFTDSDCIPSLSFITGYLNVSGQAIAYAGDVKGVPSTRLTRFYDTEEALLPRMKVNAAGEKVPLYIVTANALVWRHAFEVCGGFSEKFDSAGGEDVELSMRLWEIGSVECARSSVVMHDFSDGIVGLWKRFTRYGKGNKMLEAVAGITMKPKWRLPAHRDLYNICAKTIQHGALCYGYYTTNGQVEGTEEPSRSAF